MGCHTWYKKPLVKGKENVQKYFKDKIDEQRKQKWWNEECENEVPMRLYAIDSLDVNMGEELLEYADTDGSIIFIDNEPVIFEDASKFAIDEPRISGYPDTIIKSADEMFEAMKTGLINWEGKHHNFHIEEGRENYVKNNIIEFFKTYPDGIIEFG